VVASYIVALYIKVQNMWDPLLCKGILARAEVYNSQYPTSAVWVAIRAQY